MTHHSKEPVDEQHYLMRVDFGLAVRTLPTDFVEEIVALRPECVNQPGKTTVFTRCTVSLKCEHSNFGFRDILCCLLRVVIV